MLSGVDEAEDQHWVTYAIAMLAFTFAGFVVLYALQRLQAVLPFNPQKLDAVSPGSGVQHVGQFHNQYKLAILRAGNHHELSGADGRAHGP